ncbi:retron St85 family effector protein [Pontibacter flavimaris]|uniref:Uncharacterized protein n=1 Tax=Pontibacter flavimaris TaxID=1797110 RepID=A0A1Q5PCU1_9BACT|nr:retron St85 family effector protein [Pontibacter flavimaris]OKL40003.1 hypothetical protein A3841_16710 [Pontibacter flavimaris]
MIDEKSIVKNTYDLIYKKDVDYSLNIFLCGADTNKTKSIRNLLNIEFQKDAKFNTVFPEFVFASLFKKKKNNLFELEDDLAKNVDVIVLPLEGPGTLCELGAFTMNEELLPKIIAINDRKYDKKKSFINLGPVDLIRKQNSKNYILFEKGKEELILDEVIDRVRNQRYEKKSTYNLDNFFNLSRFILYLIALFQPITIGKLKSLLSLVETDKVKSKHIETALQILIQKNRIISEYKIDHELDFYFLSRAGHIYFYEELIEKLNIKKNFSLIRGEVINSIYKKKKKNMSRDKSLLV